MQNFKNYTNEQLIEKYRKLIELCKEKEYNLMNSGGFNKEEIKRELENFRNEKFSVVNEISKRNIEHLV
ncbi:hypothetical protein RSJ22_14075 [Clostridium botulinum]|uniref:hypothetical protein n=1 Tax=Clostridium botulinum TaxID=1491 RepID=UPI00047069E1|nr:hypothetical protein [Clostridium botulinum]AUN18194.1 hypothetical protein B2M06_11535 [Clostridium botulinum]AUN22504.1 hypothetical protein RSJ22_14075 [Clostridium botulinum]MBN3448323.1 hypothetical protein [Clostridium botulinum]NFL55656.1 hypothetical protein [Clostridium botulinum]OSA87846.1 hypothetical protein B2H91_06405 [Clostridium botulinum]